MPNALAGRGTNRNRESKGGRCASFDNLLNDETNRVGAISRHPEKFAF